MIEPSSEHREQLEEKLLASYDVGYSKLPSNLSARRSHTRWAALGAAAVLLLGILGASRAPANYGLEIGQRIEIKSLPGSELPNGPELVQWMSSSLLQDHNGPRRIELQMIRAGQVSTLRIELWGVPIEGVVEALQRHLPALAPEQISVKLLSGRVHTTLAGLLEHRLLHHDAAAREELRKQLKERLAADGDPDAEVQIFETPEGRERVLINVERKRLEDGGDAEGKIR